MLHTYAVIITTKTDTLERFPLYQHQMPLSCEEPLTASALHSSVVSAIESPFNWLAFVRFFSNCTHTVRVCVCNSGIWDTYIIIDYQQSAALLSVRDATAAPTTRYLTHYCFLYNFPYYLAPACAVL